MLTVTIPDQEVFDEQREQFVTIKGMKLQMEHSLVSISKWEAKWHKSFFREERMTPEEMIDYYRCMTITQNVPDYIYTCMPGEVVKQIAEYMNDPMTATVITERKKKAKTSSEAVTSELVYYWMTAYNIPTEFQKWHINRLITLIRVCEAKNADPEMMSKKDIAKQNAALNAARRKAHNSKG